MTASAQIDTTNLLTILGVVAAVWALISPTSKLRLRFCLAWGDWLVGSTVLLLVHYLVFAPALERLGLYYSLGPWKWQIDSSSAVYLLMLSLALYFFWRTRSPKLVRSKIHVFHELIENLYLTKRYDELVLLVEPQLPRLILMAQQQPLLARWIDHLQEPQTNLAAYLLGEKPRAKSTWRQTCITALKTVKSWSIGHAKANARAHEVLLNLVLSPDLTTHLAVAHPYFGLQFLRTDEAIRSEFINSYIDALLDTPTSRLYVELKNNQNLMSGSRLFIPDNNRLLRFFFSDAAAAIMYGLDEAIGDAVLRRLDEDRRLVGRLNEPLGSYYDFGRFRCPINSGITLYEIMVHEGIHQGLQDHMWLHYFGHFAEKILKQMGTPPDDDSYQEWPTPFHYHLYRLVSIAADWAEQCQHIDSSEIPEQTRDIKNFDRFYISKEATKLLGSLLQDIIPSEKLSMSFKTYLLDVALRCHINLQANRQLIDIASSLKTAVISGASMPTRRSYRLQLRNVFNNVDHRMRHEAAQFEEALNASLVDA
ncbi:hypothetical protein [Burkholderia sp. Ac-20365]|uniref:hypothetical protein n=1 Tax=Burkholderia sp. Ac-20365 TaxID=2703897 RepID=UPI001F11F22D|nr:hypothetical protein [Burkholderia sp. Ac-20365]MBN3760726.1 hypothetical protein [Burkholderia sp. Ac-20365]